MTVFPHPIIHHPFAYTIGFFSFTGFGLAMLMCFIIGQAVAQHELVRRGYDARPVADMTLAAVVGGLLGAKLYYVAVLGHWDAVFERGGFVFWGGLVGGTLAVMAVVVKKKFGLMRMFDVGGPAVAAAYAVGRTGCWAVGDDYGRPWNGFLAVAFPDGAPPSTAGIMAQEFHVAIPPGMSPGTLVSVYPTQLIEVALGFAMFLILWRLRDHTHAEGWLFGVYGVLAGTERFLVEFLRAKDDRFVGSITNAQIIALVYLVGGIAWMAARWHVGPGRPGIFAAPTEANLELEPPS